MSKYIHRIHIPILFKSGVAPGAGCKSNKLSIMRNGENKPVLHGSSIAGVLRSAFRTMAKFDNKKVSYWFGLEHKNESNESGTSRISISDVVLHTQQHHIENRTHTAINRHTGSAIDKGLFSFEYVPPGTTGTICMEIKGCEEKPEEDELFIKTLANICASEIFVGGNKNRGIGQITCIDGLYRERFDITTAKGYEQLLDTRYLHKKDPTQFRKDTACQIFGEAIESPFIIKLILGIPRGEDILVGYGQTVDYMLEPQSVRSVDGKERWRIPGSSFRGLFRSWMSRLAARSGTAIKDTVSEYMNGNHVITGNSIGWGFLEDENKKNMLEIKKSRAMYKQEPDTSNDPLYSLFGSFYQKGRIHFSDALSTSVIHEHDTQIRAHVSIDRFSGGSHEGALFTNKVLINPKIEFPLKITIQNARDNELQWIIKTLKALHLGVISIGSSKSSGRLIIKKIIMCTHDTVQTDLTTFLEKHS